MVIVKTKGIKFNKSRNQKTQMVFRAMAELLNEIPFRDISTTKIMVRADVSRNVVNYYFKTKKEVLRLLVEDLFNENIGYLLENNSELRPLKEPNYYCREITLEMLNMAEEYRHVFKVYREQFYQIEGLKEHYDGLIERIQSRLLVAKNSFSKIGKDREQEAKLMSKSCTLLIAAYFWEFVDGRQEEGAAAIADSLTELFKGSCNM